MPPVCCDKISKSSDIFPLFKLKLFMPLNELLYVSEFAIELAILVRRKGLTESVSTIGLVLVMILVIVLVLVAVLVLVMVVVAVLVVSVVLVLVLVAVLVLVLLVVKIVVAIVVIGIAAGTHFYL
jgi:hypothetical protein